MAVARGSWPLDVLGYTCVCECMCLSAVPLNSVVVGRAIAEHNYKNDIILPMCARPLATDSIGRIERRHRCLSVATESVTYLTASSMHKCPECVDRSVGFIYSQTFIAAAEQQTTARRLTAATTASM